MGMQKDLKVSKASLYCFIDAHVVLRIFSATYFLLPTSDNIEKTSWYTTTTNGTNGFPGENRYLSKSLSA